MDSADNSRNARIPPYFQSIVQTGKKYDCSICSRDTSSYTFILANNSVHCVSCFAKMRKWPTHYHVINKLEFPVLEESWTALEEIYLFEGLEKHGFGNWFEIAEYMETNKTRDDVEKHYTTLYLNSPNFLPNLAEVRLDKGPSVRSSKPKFQKNRQTLTSKRIQSMNMEKSQPKSAPVEIVGFMPLRKDFEFEYDNEAELLLAEMEFNEQDTEQERQMKFQIIELYNKRLTERNKKKEFILSRGILDLEKQVQMQRSLTKPEKEIYNMMKIFSRFHTAADHQELVRGIIREKQLRKKIQEYKELRRRGFTTKAEIEEEIEKKNETKNKKKSGTDYGFSGLAESSRHNRRNQQHPEPSSKKPSIYFSEQELDLLRSLKLSGVSYMMIKETLLRENAKLGFVNRETAAAMFSVERFIVDRIVDFLAGNEEIVCI